MGLWYLHCVLFVFRFYAAAKHLWNLFCTWLQNSGCIWTQRGINSHTVSCMCSIIWWQLHPFGPVGAGWTQKPSLWPICEVRGQLSPPAPPLTAEPSWSSEKEVNRCFWINLPKESQWPFRIPPSRSPALTEQPWLQKVRTQSSLISLFHRYSLG